MWKRKKMESPNYDRFARTVVLIAPIFVYSLNNDFQNMCFQIFKAKTYTHTAKYTYRVYAYATQRYGMQTLL